MMHGVVEKIVLVYSLYGVDATLINMYPQELMKITKMIHVQTYSE